MQFFCKTLILYLRYLGERKGINEKIKFLIINRDIPIGMWE